MLLLSSVQFDDVHDAVGFNAPIAASDNAVAHGRVPAAGQDAVIKPLVQARIRNRHHRASVRMDQSTLHRVWTASVTDDDMVQSRGGAGDINRIPIPRRRRGRPAIAIAVPAYAIVLKRSKGDRLRHGSLGAERPSGLNHQTDARGELDHRAGIHRESGSARHRDVAGKNMHQRARPGFAAGPHAPMQAERVSHIHKGGFIELACPSSVIPLQSPGSGSELLPSKLLSPPAVSSASEVSMMGLPAVAGAFKTPPLCTMIPVPGANFTIAPGSMVSVAPLATVTSASMIFTVPTAQVSLPAIHPECQAAALFTSTVRESSPRVWPESSVKTARNSYQPSLTAVVFQASVPAELALEPMKFAFPERTAESWTLIVRGGKPPANQAISSVPWNNEFACSHPKWGTG